MEDKQWWKVTVQWQEIDTQSSLLFDIGAQGIHHLSDNEFECFFRGNKSEIEIFSKNIVALGAFVLLTENVKEFNWLEKCEEVWEPLQIESLSIIPVLDRDAAIPNGANAAQILIVPGEGFGTGHHASTRFAIELMHRVKTFSVKQTRALDVGCGSGILALAMNKLFSIPVDAIENDPAAISNAKCNFELNNSDMIRPGLQPLSELRPEYSLIAANIYAEVLIDMQPEFKRLLRNSGYLILSGIMSNLINELLSSFSGKCWELLEKKDNGHWAAVLYKHNKL
jgi:ribosomal protein L11 methyltransferase